MSLREPIDLPHVRLHEQYRKGDERNHAFRTESLTDAVRLFDTAPDDVGPHRTDGDDPDERRASRYNQEERNVWAGGTWQEVREHALYGWAEGVEKVGGIIADLDDLVALGDKPGLVLGEEGAEIDIDRYLQGEPDCWNTWDSMPQQPVQRITCLVGYNFNVSPEVMHMTGATAAAVADSMEQAGIRTELWAASATHSLSDNLIMVPIKRSEEPLNMDSISFGFSHPGMLRRIMFGIKEHMWRYYGRGNDKGMNGYGRSMDADKVQDKFGVDLGLVMGGGAMTIRDLDQAVSVIETQLKEAGVELDYR